VGQWRRLLIRRPRGSAGTMQTRRGRSHSRFPSGA